MFAHRALLPKSIEINISKSKGRKCFTSFHLRAMAVYRRGL